MKSVHNNRDRYKEKVCGNTKCGKTHKKRGPYCSQACSNSARIVSDNVRENMRKVGAEYKQSPEGIANSLMVQNPVKAEDFAIDIPTLDHYNIPDGYDIADDW